MLTRKPFLQTTPTGPVFVLHLSARLRLCPLTSHGQFWQLPDSQEDIFNLFSPTDIRKIRDEAFNNLETLILSVTSRLFSLAQHPSFPSPEAAPEREALNCIRILTRLIPYIYELEQLESWEERFFWKPRKRRDRVGQQAGRAEVLFDEAAPDTQQGEVQQPEDADVKPLAEELIDVLIELLFCSDFTIPRAQGRKKVQFTIWQSGVGCNSTIASTADMENRRMEILRLLLTLASKSMYTSTSEAFHMTCRMALRLIFREDVLPVQGVKAITYITTLADKQLVLTLLCSLLNTVRLPGPIFFQSTDDDRLSSTTRLLGNCHMITSYSRTRSSCTSRTACNYSSYSCYILYPRLPTVRHPRTIFDIT